MYPFEVPLARAHVFFDFDGTLTPVDVGVHLLDRFAPATWRDSEERYDRGEIGSRECMVEQWALMPPERDLLLAAAAEVPLDPAFPVLLEALRTAGARVTVVSDGFGFHVEDRLAPFGVEVLTNAVDWSTGELTFPQHRPVLPLLDLRHLQAGARQGRPGRRPGHRLRRRRDERPQGGPPRRRPVRQGGAGRLVRRARRRVHELPHDRRRARRAVRRELKALPETGKSASGGFPGDLTPIRPSVHCAR